MSTIISILEFGVEIGIAYAVAFGIYHAVVSLAKKVRGGRTRHFDQVYVRGYGRVDVGSQYLIKWLMGRALDVLEHSSCGPTGRTVVVRGRRRRPPARGYVFVTGPRQFLANLVDELSYLASFSDERFFDDGPGWNDDACPHFAAVYVAGHEERTGRRFYSVELRYGPEDLKRLNAMLRREVSSLSTAQSVGVK